MCDMHISRPLPRRGSHVRVHHCTRLTSTVSTRRCLNSARKQAPSPVALPLAHMRSRHIWPQEAHYPDLRESNNHPTTSHPESTDTTTPDNTITTHTHSHPSPALASTNCSATPHAPHLHDPSAPVANAAMPPSLSMSSASAAAARAQSAAATFIASATAWFRWPNFVSFRNLFQNMRLGCQRVGCPRQLDVGIILATMVEGADEARRQIFLGGEAMAHRVAVAHLFNQGWRHGKRAGDLITEDVAALWNPHVLCGAGPVLGAVNDRAGSVLDVRIHGGIFIPPTDAAWVASHLNFTVEPLARRVVVAHVECQVQVGSTLLVPECVSAVAGGDVLLKR
eukprot:CAMPEP_0181196322 /NCGR_PEP_ID=MMETSP1096-20121128/15398_1 /TAXON_ID=156174 ORGANISM="Chrysochromulina ericina, Strain CCMP281" /NCGR_SAMPLE_ID=MMETSP1096 /ASSEMBLY_ACC=CAM_ASM_000453 /LENGTH=337 /DNA_ID=CAMNT_0023286063 /DNA_START=176 /DNA_END=1190 /DNA_ORIENTATION=+